MSIKAPSLIRVLLIDDHISMRAGLRMLLESQKRLAVVGEAGNLDEALAAIKREPPDIILLDLDLNGVSGITLLPELLGAADKARVIIMTGVRDPEQHRQAIHRGAMGLVLKERAPAEIYKAILKVHEGEVWLDRSTIGKVLTERSGNRNKGTDPEAQKIATLTKQERAVIGLLSEGLKNRQIAERLFISEKTVIHHLSHIYHKLEVTDRLELYIYAQTHRLFDSKR